MTDPAPRQENPHTEPDALPLNDLEEPIIGVNLDAELGSGTKPKVRISEDARLAFAKQVFFWLVLICIGVFAGYAYSPKNEALEQIFELVKIGALPLVTLVISFYFPKHPES